MRDYKFRGKRKDNREWVYGFYWEVNDESNVNKPCITVSVPGSDDFRNYEVIRETIGQFTGLKDKNGNDIYEGDTVKFHYFFQSLGENLGVQESEHELIGNIVWGKFGWSIDAIKGQHWEGYTGYQRGEGECSILELYSMNQSSIHEESFEVIGNIHDVKPAVQDSVIINMNIEPNVKTEEVKEQATEDQAAINAAEDQANDAQGEPKEEGTTEG